MTHINTHYLDAYSDWSVALFGAKSWYDVAKTHKLAVRTTDLMEEWVDAKQLDPNRHLSTPLKWNNLSLINLKSF